MTQAKGEAEFYCHERDIPTCETQCMDCQVWAALVDEKCNPTIEQKDKTIKVILRAYEQLRKSAKGGEQAPKKFFDTAREMFDDIDEQNRTDKHEAKGIDWKIQEWANLIGAGHPLQAFNEMHEYLSQFS